MYTKTQIADSFRALQLHICAALEQLDGKATFHEDAWQREAGGGGFTRVIAEGNVLEKGGVAFSAVHGEVSAAMKKQLQLDGESFYATGVSIVLHPKHPRHPIMHMNVRYFELDNGTYWFGGGIDLTPHYVDWAKAQQFHGALKQLSDQFHPDFYPNFKEWADRYFFLPHRGESRGVGGIFFDHLDESSGLTKEALFTYCLDLGRLFSIVYSDQIHGVPVQAPTKNELAWQATRRGRYVEFNLLHDRGTKFGIYSGGRTESILMSMPPMANWHYNQELEPGSEEEKTLSFLKQTHHYCLPIES
jgi:coproporphyrinogen III oxidase